MLHIVLGVVALILAWFLLPFALRKRGEARLEARCRAARAIVLSYDDGPSSGLTPRLLDLLGETGAKATFFLLGRNTETREAIVARALAEGHEIGSHTFDHSNAWKTQPLRAARDLARGIATVARLGGDARLYRPPYGKLTLATWVQCHLRAQRLGWWTVDSKDTEDGPDRRRIDDILAQLDTRGGGVVLAHDFDRADDATNPDSHADYVVDLTRRVISFAREKDYRILPLRDLPQAGTA